MINVWAARSGDRIRVQTVPFGRAFPAEWEVRAGAIPDGLADAWAKGTGEHEAAIWGRLNAPPA